MSQPTREEREKELLTKLKPRLEEKIARHTPAERVRQRALLDIRIREQLDKEYPSGEKK